MSSAAAAAAGAGGGHHALHAAGAGSDREDRVSRTQYQYTLEDPDAEELASGCRKLVDKLKALPQLRDVASDQQNGAAAPSW
jgi:multidrug efflux pump subunit AcrB